MIKGCFIDIEELQGDELLNRVRVKTESIGVEKLLYTDPAQRQHVKLAGQLMLHKLLSDHNLHDTLFVNTSMVDKWGKPYLANADFDYNFSHSGSIVFCAGVPGGRIGVDIEKEEERDITNMRDHFSEKEWNRINSSENINAEFYRMWVRKESCVKAIGKGIFQSLNEIDVCNDEVICDGLRWFLQDVFIRKGYTACIAANKKMDITIEEVDLNKLLS